MISPPPDCEDYRFKDISTDPLTFPTDEGDSAQLGSLESERILFPGIFECLCDPICIVEKKENMGVREVEKTLENRADTMREPCILPDPEEYLEPQPSIDNLQTQLIAYLSAPPTSYSNPETPIEPLDMSLNTTSPGMTRNLSEQTGLSPRRLKGVNPALEPAYINQRLNSTALLPASVSITRAQAGPERSAQSEPPYRNARDAIGHSNSSNSGTARSGNQTRSHSPQVRTRDMPIYPYQSQVHPQESWERAQESWERDPRCMSGYYDPHQVNSQYMAISSSYGENQLHGNVTHGNVNFPRRLDNLLLEQPATYPPNIGYYPTTSNPNKRSYQIMKHEELSPDAGQSRLKYLSLDHARKEKTCSTHNGSHDHTFPRTADYECHYVERIMEAMLDMSVAEDNDGMKRTWETMMRDKDKVEKAAWEMINLCIERHKRNGPFELSPKASRQFDTFEDRVQAVCEAVQSQKTMCKHLLRQPFIEEVIEDPIAAVSRIKNNRKVNFGKKEAIDKGREALGEKALKTRRPSKVAFEDTDEELEGEHDNEYGTHAGALLHGAKKHSSAQRRRSQAACDDQSYGEGPAPKKAKRSSSSMYQLNEHNQMIDTTLPQPKHGRRQVQQSSSQNLDVNSGNPYDWSGIHGAPGQGTRKEVFTGTDFDGHQQAELERRRSTSRR